MALRLVPMLQTRKTVSNTKRVTRSRLNADFILGELLLGYLFLCFKLTWVRLKLWGVENVAFGKYKYLLKLRIISK